MQSVPKSKDELEPSALLAKINFLRFERECRIDGKEDMLVVERSRETRERNEWELSICLYAYVIWSEEIPDSKERCGVCVKRKGEMGDREVGKERKKVEQVDAKERGKMRGN